MYMDMTSIDLLDQNVGMTCAIVRLRSSWILLELIYLIKNVGMVCANIRLRC